MSVMETATVPYILRRYFAKRLILVAGVANPELAARSPTSSGWSSGDASPRRRQHEVPYAASMIRWRGADVFIVQPNVRQRAAV